jgi:hypothetical protein
MRARRRFLLVTLSGLLIEHAPRAHAQSEDSQVKTACLTAHEQAQAARRALKFSEARAQLRACAQEGCPGLVRADCVSWLSELEKTYPVVIFDAHIDGQQALNARVYLDGRLVTDRIDGRPFEVDPGRHSVVIEVPDFPPNEQVVVISEGKQDRVISASFTHSIHRPIPLSVWLAVGIAAAGTVSVAVFGAMALSEKGSLQRSCAPFCADAQLVALRRNMLAADISLAVLAAAGVTAGVLFLTRPERRRGTEARWMSAAPVAGGAVLAYGAAF